MIDIGVNSGGVWGGLGVVEIRLIVGGRFVKCNVGCFIVEYFRGSNSSLWDSDIFLYYDFSCGGIVIDGVCNL